MHNGKKHLFTEVIVEVVTKFILVCLLTNVFSGWWAHKKTKHLQTLDVFYITGQESVSETYSAGENIQYCSSVCTSCLKQYFDYFS